MCAQKILLDSSVNVSKCKTKFKESLPKSDRTLDRIGDGERK